MGGTIFFGGTSRHKRINIRDVMVQYSCTLIDTERLYGSGLHWSDAEEQGFQCIYIYIYINIYICIYIYIYIYIYIFISDSQA